MRFSRDRLRFYSLYVVGFANFFGLITLTTLLPTYIDLLEPSGIVIGLFVTGLTAAQAIAIVPFGWAGDRFDKRTLLIVALIVSLAAYALFPVVETSAGFVAVRFLQGIGVVGVGLLSLSLVGELAPAGERGSTIGTYNAFKLAAGLVGTLSAGWLYDRHGFPVVFGLLVVLLLLATLATGVFTTRDRSRISFAFGALALNRRILSLASFRVPYGFGVMMVRNWVPIFVGVSAAQGGLGHAAVVVGVVIAAERFTNMLCQPWAGRLSDASGRAAFVFAGGGAYGLVALLVPFAPAIGARLGFEAAVPFPVLGSVSGAVLVVVVLNGLLGIADSFREPASMALFADEGAAQGGVASSFGIRNLLWHPGSIVGPLLAGVLMGGIGIEWVFWVGGAVILGGVALFLAVLVATHGRAGLRAW